MRDDRCVRTTLDIDDDVLQAAKELGALRGKTAGQVVSELARRALSPSATHRLRNGVPVLPRRPAGRPRPTMRLVKELRDDA
jgi:Arc/MetJ family transcription regulator